MTSRTWLITGVSSGFGRELTDQLLERGDSVVGTVRRPDAVADLADRHPDTLHRPSGGVWPDAQGAAELDGA